jgi:serine/threonine protein kinase
MSLLSLGDVLDGYRLDDVIGRGGMGTVYRATDLSLNKTVALKVVSADLGADPKFVDRFRVEAQALGRLDHPGIVRVLAFREHDPLLVLVMEYVAGSSLAAFLSRHAPLAPQRAVPLFQQMAAAVAHAHAAGVLHRDLKPSNILLTPDGQPKITDFGLARIVAEDARLTSTHERAGTTAYMAPEQIRGLRQVGPAADLFALGLVFFEVLTGRLPYRLSGSSFEIQQRILEATFPPPSQFAPSVPAALEALVIDLLRKDPGDRPAGMAAVTERLDALSPDSSHRSASPPLPPSSGSGDLQTRTGAARIWGIAGTVVALLVAAMLFLLSPLGPFAPAGGSGPEADPLLHSDSAGADAAIDWTALNTTPLLRNAPSRPDTVQSAQEMRRAAGVGTPEVVPGSLRLAALLKPTESDADPPDTVYLPPAQPSPSRPDTATASPSPPDAQTEGRTAVSRSSNASPPVSTEPELESDPDRPVPATRPLPAGLLLRISPEADVYLNDSLIARSSRLARADSLPPGEYDVLVTSPLGRWQKQIRLTAGTQIDRTVDFNQQVNLSILAQTPQGAPIPNAAVFIDGTPRGYTPQRVTLRVGERRVRVERPGYALHEQFISVEPGMRSPLIIELSPAP